MQYQVKIPIPEKSCWLASGYGYGRYVAVAPNGHSRLFFHG
jgi:hypothetical protein